jgi:integrase
MNERKKMLPKKDAPKGLYLYCKKHDRWYKNDNVVKCNCALKYKAKLHISGTKRNSRTHTYSANDTEVAIQIFQQFKLKMKNNDFQKVEIKQKINKPILILDCIDDFMRHKRDENVPDHAKADIKKATIRNLEMCCEYVTFALSDNGIDVKVFKFESFSSVTVGHITTFIKEKIKANKTYNNYVSNVQSFAKYIYEKYYPQLENPFKNLKKFKKRKDVRAITKVEFMKVIDVTTLENGTSYEKKGSLVKKVNFFRPWLIDAFYLGLFAGGRNEETVEMKWSDIKINEEGQMSLIEIIDYKITRLEKNSGIENIPYTKTVEMTPEFENMLREMGYEENKNSNRYIIAPEENVSRKTVQNNMSKAFTHFYNLLDLPVKKTFKHLRKTYMTNCYIQTDDTKEFLIKTGHANLETPLSHYVDMRMVMEARRKKLYDLKNKIDKTGLNDSEINENK